MLGSKRGGASDRNTVRANLQSSQNRGGLAPSGFEAPSIIPISILSKILKVVYFLMSIGVIFGSSYLLGHEMLEGVLGGNDTNWALSLVHWFNRWFPDLPIWYTLQGAGTPLLIFYPPLVSLLAVVVHRFAQITEAQALSVVGFFSIPIAASGIYVLVWVKLRNQTAALLSGLLYLLSSASWYWLSIMGMYAQGVSLMFFPFAYLLADLYIARSVSEKGRTARYSTKLVLLAAAILYALTLLAHGTTALVLSMTILLHAIVVPFVNSPKRWVGLLAGYLRPATTCIVAGIGMAAFWFLPFLSVIRLANREGLSEFAAHQIPYTYLSAIIGIGDPSPSVFSAGLTFAPPVVVLAAAGAFWGITKKRSVLVLAVISVAFALYTSMPGIWPRLVSILPNLWAYTQARAMVPAIVLMPAVAGCGAAALAKGLLYLPGVALGRLAKAIGSGFSRGIGPASSLVRKLSTSILALVIAGLAVFWLNGVFPNTNRFGRYGPPTGTGELPVGVEAGRLVLLHPPSFSVTSFADPNGRQVVSRLNEELSLSEAVRIDTSPSFGGLTQALGIYSTASNLNTYNYQSSLIHAMWGYQQGLFYGEGDAIEAEINVLSGWLGLQYVITANDYDSTKHFDSEMWPIVYPKDDQDDPIMQIRAFAEAPELASYLDTPTVLVIGGYEDSIYEQVFLTFAKAGISYDQALIVEGAHNVDAYSIDELKQFDGVFLHGYDYKNRAKAWGLLEEYVDSGGSLFVDTGWQFWTPDWETEQAPQVLPVNGLRWTHLGTTSEYRIADRSWDGLIDVLGFDPLEWNGQPWGVSSPAGGLRDWAVPILEVKGTPLVVAGEYGNGRVIWSGMNLLGHAATYDNAAEREFLRQLVSWLTPIPQDPEKPPPRVEREHPDHIRFLLDGSISDGPSLLWREAYSPDWRAQVEVDGRTLDVPIYRAGPGMMLLRLPSVDAQHAILTMDYRLGWKGWSGLGISLLTTMALGSAVIWPSFPKNLRGKFSRRRSQRIPQDLWDRPGQEKEPRPTSQLTLDGEEQVSRELAKSQAAHIQYSEPLWEVDEGIADPLEVQQLWADNVARGKVAGPEDDQANQLISWWRSSRSIEKESDSSSEK